MKTAIPSGAGHAQKVAEPARSGRQQQNIASSSSLAQLAATMNSSSRTHSLTQLQNDIQQSPRMAGLMGLAAEMNHGAPVPLHDVPSANHEELKPGVTGTEEKSITPSLPSGEPAPVIQRYTVEEAPEDKQIYSRSNNQNMITGMGSPNHDFFVAHTNAFPVMNGLIQGSPLELFPRSKKQLFTKTMHQVGLRYATSRLKDESRKEQIKRKKVKEKFFEPDERGSLQLQYEKNVLPNIKLYRENIAKETLQNIQQLGFTKPAITAIRRSLYDLMTSLNLFKKVFTAELANKGEFDQESQDLAAVALGLIQTVENPLYKNDLTKGDLAAAKQSLLETWFDEDDRDNPNIISKIVYRILDTLDALIQEFPDGQQVNMNLFHKYNFNLEIIQKLYDRDNLVLYRACDVQASTLLGNKITPENAHQLKNYNAGVGGAFHYATKILASGVDWVTLEHFAASERERLISGTEGAKFKNLDHTWQFIMQGAHPSTVEGVSPEDKYFEIYTKVRYYLKGLVNHERGGFDTSRRDRLERSEEERFVQLGDSSQLSNVMGWRAFYNGIADTEEEKKLITSLTELEKVALLEKEDPLVFAKQSWDDLMALQKK